MIRQSLLLGLLLLPMLRAQPGVFIDAPAEARRLFGSEALETPSADLSAAIVSWAESLPVGGAIDLDTLPCGELDFRRVSDRVQITGGRDGTLALGGGQHGIELMFSRLNQVVAPGLDRPADRRDPLRADTLVAARDWTFKDGAMFGDKLSPLSEFFALFCSGGIRIHSDVRDCAWICGDNAFGDHVVTADARVDRSLFLWFGLNWPFRDFNAHWTDGGKTDWIQRGTQMHFNLKGGGRDTRLYHMVETNYGNPGVGVWLENANGLTVMHGSTERSSAQGPGVYWLKNCENTLLGLRGINAFGGNDGGPRVADANRDITIEGGKGNRLYAMRTWSNANDVSIDNSDPALELWCVGSQYGHRGTENALRYAVTPYYNRPTPAFLESFDVKSHAQAIHEKRSVHLAKEWEKRRAEAEKKKKPFDEAKPVPHESVETLAAKIRTGRHLNCPGQIDMNATDEETFRLGKTDLALGEKPAGKLPAPPQVPPTDAPRTRRPVAFTQQPDFGRALLDAGADPTGKTPSDDAFARLLYGMSRAELQGILDELERQDRAIWAMHEGNEDRRKAARETEAFRTARGKISDAMKRISRRRDEAKAAGEARLKELGQELEAAKRSKDESRKRALENQRDALEKSIRGGEVRLDIPAGTFLLRQPLWLLGGIRGVWGAGEKSVLRTDQPIHLVNMQERTTVAQVTFEGGRVGLAMTGADHHDNDGAPSRKSYIAGENFYALTFRDQTLAGMLIGNEDPGVMGGSEHDQNKYVDLRFENTGDYGICMNGSMLDKWLVLHSSFSGQKKAGIAVKFNNLIHGMIVGSRFENINGPGLDTFGGNVEIGYRPWEVWVDQCEFLECGNGTEPAVEMGLTELSAFTHSTITTKGKTIAGGFAGSPQIFEDCAIDVKLAPGAPAVKLRAVRLESVVRANGHVVRDVRANGPLVFVNDANSQGEHFARTIERLTAQGKPHVEKWDTNSMVHTLPPKNGWVHPFLFYRSGFGGETFPYALLNVNMEAGRILERVDLAGFE